ncbi:hypothetical protein L596_025715 [Steinernema carpocapsae]|uniref:Uncharacterized protein n=1 Tax=Steinernema carpocapsae TaxID=34508 RepID=A0A4U5M8T2_STECR|nr:hypothetical protein L596_025715 [Steinernema carpocapsae]
MLAESQVTSRSALCFVYAAAENTILASNNDVVVTIYDDRNVNVNVIGLSFASRPLFGGYLESRRRGSSRETDRLC